MGQPLEKRLSEYLELQRDRIAKTAKASKKDPSSKNVHQLRVSLRRLKTAVWMGRHSSQKLKTAGLPSALGKTSSRLGKIRDLDVMMGYAGRFHLDSHKLESERRKLMKKARKKIDSDWRHEVLLEVDGIVHRVLEHPGDLSPGIRKVKKDLTRWLKTPVRHANLHGLRIAVKKTRYCLEVLGKPVESLKSLQDLLGQIHDLENFEARFKRSAQAARLKNALEQQVFRILGPILVVALKELGEESRGGT